RAASRSSGASSTRADDRRADPDGAGPCPAVAAGDRADRRARRGVRLPVLGVRPGVERPRHRDGPGRRPRPAPGVRLLAAGGADRAGDPAPSGRGGARRDALLDHRAAVPRQPRPGVGGVALMPAASIEALSLCSPVAPLLVLSAALQGIGSELPFALTRYRRYGWGVFAASGALGAGLVFFWTAYRMGWYGQDLM